LALNRGGAAAPVQGFCAAGFASSRGAEQGGAGSGRGPAADNILTRLYFLDVIYLMCARSKRRRIINLQRSESYAPNV